MAAAKKVAVKALVNITHDGAQFKIGEILKVNEDESKELKDRGCVEILKKQPNGTNSGEGEEDEKDSKDENKGGE